MRCVTNFWYDSRASGMERVAESLLARSDQRSTSDFTRANHARLACSYTSSSSFCILTIASLRSCAGDEVAPDFPFAELPCSNDLLSMAILTSSGLQARFPIDCH